MALSWLRRHGGLRPSGYGQSPKAADGSRDRPGVPSPEVTGRLVGAVGGELDQLRSDVAEELVLIRLLVDAGHAEAASRLIDEQSERLRHFQDRVEAAVASAVVERTAEEILAAAAETPEGADFGPHRVVVGGPREAVDFGARRAAGDEAPKPRLRPLVTAACLVLLVAVFVSGGPLPALYELVSGRSSGSSEHGRNGERRAGEDTSAAPGDTTKWPRGVAPAPAENVLDGSVEAPKILLLLGRLARFAEDTRGAPVVALLDVDRFVARLVTEVAPQFASLPPVPPRGEAAPAGQPAEPNTAAQPQPNSQPQPPAAGELANQPQPGGQPPADTSLVPQPAAPADEGDSLEEQWRKQREEREPAPQPAETSPEVAGQLGQRP
ncbi:MAG: hypothetical protein M3O70_23095 [Actinomycetota bacterium]|nr:hypothetical protein [Actinomycetota bacterium]